MWYGCNKEREQWRYEMYEVLAGTPIVCILEWNFIHLMDVSCGLRLVYMFVVFNQIFLTWRYILVLVRTCFRLLCLLVRHFRLYRCIMDASLNSCGIASYLHTQWKKSVSFSAMRSPPALWTSAGIASAPGALSDDSCWTAFLVSMTVGNLSNRTLHSICGSLSIISSLMLEGRFSTL